MKEVQYRIDPAGSCFVLTRVTKHDLKGGNLISIFELIGAYDNMQELVWFIQEDLKYGPISN